MLGVCWGREESKQQCLCVGVEARPGVHERKEEGGLGRQREEDRRKEEDADV